MFLSDDPPSLPASTSKRFHFSAFSLSSTNLSSIKMVSETKTQLYQTKLVSETMLMHSTVNYDSLALDFMPVVGKSVMRVIADVAAVEAGLSPSDVSNVKYEGREASCFEISTGNSKELHVFVHESAKLAYIIATTLNNRQESATFDRVYDIQMPQNPKGGWGGDGAISSSKKK